VLVQRRDRLGSARAAICSERHGKSSIQLAPNSLPWETKLERGCSEGTSATTQMTSVDNAKNRPLRNDFAGR
jgi:hypothetical protein